VLDALVSHGPAYVNASYDAETAYMDEHLRPVFARLTALGLAQDTVVIITADHGEVLDEHDGYYDHHGLYEANWGPRMQDILHASLLTLAGRGDASLCVLPALLTNPTVRRCLRAGIDDPIALEPFWAWFDAISDAERLQATSPVLNKLRPFLLRKSVRAIVGTTNA